MRIGHGYDIHRLTEGRRLFLGGVEIPYSKGLLGHSDADVAIHALCDALLGAAALGDIGMHFPDNDPQYKDISSLKLLEQVVLKLDGYAIQNADITIVAQSPKLMPYIGEMRRILANAMGICIDDINVKATTNEGLDAVGRGEAIAAHSVALIKKI